MPRRILIVDDVDINRHILRKMLQGEYELLEAANGKEALDALLGMPESFSAVLLDIIMPVMDGYEVLERMRADKLLAQIPVIVTTGSTETGVEVKALALGANDFVLKPYNPEVIRRRLWNAINLRETAAFLNSAKRDNLTGLYNREAFFERAAELIAAHEAGYYVIASFDVNNFKVINDQYGTVRGDAVLKHIADVFRSGFEPVGGVCCRVSADNYAVIYPKSFMDTKKLAAIRRAAAKPPSPIHYALTFSIGRYIVDDLSLSVSSMFDRALLAEASVKGRYDVHVALYDESMRDRLLNEQKIVNEMSGALKGGRFEMWLQPQYNHATGALIGAEALVRWRAKDGSLIQPSTFIPVFERNGFIYEMDKYVWQQACALLRKWLDEGLSPLPISVNVSRRDVFREDFFEVMTGLVEEYSIPLDLLRLEVTESAFSQSTELIVAIVNKLIAFGFTVEIDDFGSGYSSLNTLKDVPASILKLDMRFLEGDSGSERSGNILESIVRMARWLGMSVIAEGVETKVQADYLSSIGCCYVQGYFYAGPMTVSDYERLAASSGREEAMMALETVEMLDNNAFWSPSSMDTLIFNSFVGAACIFEHRAGNAELLRVNRKFLEMLGLDASAMAANSGFSLNSIIDDNYRAAVSRAVHLAIDTGDEVTAEVALKSLVAGGEKTYLFATMRAIARAGDRCLFYCIASNLTAQREAEQSLEQSVEQLRFLNDTAHDLLSQTDSAKAIERVLWKLLEYFDGDRVYVIELDYVRRIAINTYEVCADGVESELANLQEITFAEADFWFKTFAGNDYVDIANVAELDDSRAEERQTLQQQGITSLVAVPLRRDGVLIGFLGVDDPRRSRSHADRLDAIGDYIAVMLTRRDLNAKIASDTSALMQLMQSPERTGPRIAGGDCPTAGELLLALARMGKTICLYDVATHTLAAPNELAAKHGYPALLTNMPERLASSTHFDGKGLQKLAQLFQDILAGAPSGSAETYSKCADGAWCYELHQFVSIFDENGKPTIAIISIDDTTRRHEMDDETEALKERERMFRTVAAHSNRTIYRYDIATRTEYTGVGGSTVVDTDVPESVIARGDVLPESVDDYRRLFRKIHNGVPEGSANVHMRAADGTLRWLEMRYSLVYSAGNAARSAVISLLDVTDNHEKELAYDRYLQTIGHHSAADGRLMYLVSDVTADIIEKRGGAMIPSGFPAAGCCRDRVINYAINRYIPEARRESCRQFFSREHLITVFSDGNRNLSTDWSVVFPNGSDGFVRAEQQLVQDPYSGHIKVYTVLSDITEAKRAELDVKKLAETDGMTGLYNKATTEALISQLLSRSAAIPCTLLIADLDDFKKVNDGLGHPQGDYALRLMADALKKHFRQTDVIGRIGGDEFIVFLDGVSDARKLQSILSSLMRRLSQLKLGENNDIPLCASLGVAIGESGSSTFDELYRKADKALYHAKGSGKGRYLFYSTEME